MNKHLLRCFQNEIAKQCQCGILAIEDLEEAIWGIDTGKLSSTYGMSRIWMSVQTFLVAVGNISKLLWPPRPRMANRGTDLRASLDIEESSCLKTRSFRNHFEHFDERLEEFFLSLDPEQFCYIDSNISPGGISSFAGNIEDSKVLRHLDSKSWRLLFRGESYELKPLYEEIVELSRKAEAVAREH